MTTAPLKQTPSLPIRPPAASAGTGAPSLDIAKILKKYAWLLVASVIVGVLLGVASFLVLRRVYPIFESHVYFQVLAPKTTLETMENNKDQDEQERFALTQVAEMKSDAVIQKVVTDPRLQTQTGAWSAQFTSGGSFRAADAAEWLQDNLSVRLVPSTDIIEMKLGWKSAPDVHAVVGLVREAYTARLEEQTRNIHAPQRQALEEQIATYQQRLEDKQRLREQILRDDQVDSIEQRWTNENLQLQGVLTTLHNVRNAKEAAQTQLARYEAELNAQGGPTYSDELKQAVDAEPMIQGIQQTISSLKAQRASLQRQGYAPEHRIMQSNQSQIESYEAELDEQRDRLLRKRFDAILDGMRNMIATYAAQETELAAEQERLVTRLVDLNRILARVKDIDSEIEGILMTKAQFEASLQNLSSVSRLETSKRVIVSQRERIPDKPVFPDPLYMVPAGVILCLGLTTGLVFLRELLDQRVKGPADVAMIPRTRVLGLVPDASEDTATPNDQAHRAFVAAPKGVLAESFRQIRSPLLKQMDLAGHKSVVILGSMPASGTSTVATNLAEAAAASGRRTLIIDANFRRPSQHTNFKVADAPGLADVLSGASSVRDAAVATNSEHLYLLPAGNAAERIVERLAGQRFGECLAAAAAEFDLVVIDTPPAVVAGDGLSIANRCDASVLVVRAYAEKRGLVARMRNQLADSRAEFLGVVVNGVKASAGGYLRGNIRASQDYAGKKA